MIDYVHKAISCIKTQLNNQTKNNNQNHIWLLYGDEGMGKSTIANAFSSTEKSSVSYKCYNEFDLSYHVTRTFALENYNRHFNLYQPLIKKIKSEQIHTIIFDIDGSVSADYFDLIYYFYDVMNQQNYQLNIVLFVDSNIYHHNQNLFAKYPQLVYLRPLKKWENIDFFQLWEEFYENSELNTDILKLVASYSMGNAGVFLRHLNNLKHYNILCFENGEWKFSDKVNIEDFLKENFSEIVKKKYELLEPSMQTIIKQTSTIGYIFHKNDLSEVFNVENATVVLKQIEIITELLYFTDAKLETGKFDSVQVQKQIEKKIDTKHHKEWCIALAQYYESKIEVCNPSSIEKYNYKEKCILYYEKARETSKIIYHYVSLVPLLCNLNLYNSALKISNKLNDLTKGQSEYIHFYQYSFYLLSQIYRNLSNYHEALYNLKKYIEINELEKRSNELDYLFAELLYGTGKTPNAYNLLKSLYKKRDYIDDPVLKINIISLLASVEETTNNQQYIKHYNEALSLCSKNNLVKYYYKLLRKANMAHEGKNGIMLMKKAEKYFKKCNDIIELIMVKHNIGTESLFYESTYNNAVMELKYAYKAAYEYGFNQLSYIVNSLAIVDIFEKKYEQALKKISNLLQFEHEDFTLVALYINKTTCLLNLGIIDETIITLKKAKQINLKEQNKIPFFTSQIVLLESYIYLLQHKISESYSKLCQYFSYGFLDRSTGIVSAKIILDSLCKKYHYKYPDNLTNLSDNCDYISIKMATNHLVLCDLMFWE